VRTEAASRPPHPGESGMLLRRKDLTQFGRRTKLPGQSRLPETRFWENRRR